MHRHVWPQADGPALIGGGRALTFAELREAATEVAAGLDGFTGQRVLIVAPNAPEFVSRCSPCGVRGRSPCRSATRSREHELSTALTDSGAVAALAVDAHGGYSFATALAALGLPGQETEHGLTLFTGGDESEPAASGRRRDPLHVGQHGRTQGRVPHPRRRGAVGPARRRAARADRAGPDRAGDPRRPRLRPGLHARGAALRRDDRVRRQRPLAGAARPGDHRPRRDDPARLAGGVRRAAGDGAAGARRRAHRAGRRGRLPAGADRASRPRRPADPQRVRDDRDRPRVRGPAGRSPRRSATRRRAARWTATTCASATASSRPAARASRPATTAAASRRSPRTAGSAPATSPSSMRATWWCAAVRTRSSTWEASTCSRPRWRTSS